MNRRALLKPSFRSLYPELPAGVWLPAWEAALKRAEHLWEREGAVAMTATRLLSDDHFEFDGGVAREPGWYVRPERLSDPSAERPPTDESDR
jgi:hypothetical protein